MKLKDLELFTVAPPAPGWGGRYWLFVKLTTDDGSVIHDFLQTGEQPIFEFDVPQKATADGKVTFIWNCGEGERGSQVTEIWLMKK